MVKSENEKKSSQKEKQNGSHKGEFPGPCKEKGGLLRFKRTQVKKGRDNCTGEELTVGVEGGSYEQER